MSGRAVEPPRASGVCSFCGERAEHGVVIIEIHSGSGPGYTVVRHDEHVGLAKRARADQPRTYPR